MYQADARHSEPRKSASPHSRPLTSTSGNPTCRHSAASDHMLKLGGCAQSMEWQLGMTFVSSTLEPCPQMTWHPCVLMLPMSARLALLALH